MEPRAKRTRQRRQETARLKRGVLRTGVERWSDKRPSLVVRSKEMRYGVPERRIAFLSSGLETRRQKARVGSRQAIVWRADAGWADLSDAEHGESTWEHRASGIDIEASRHRNKDIDTSRQLDIETSRHG
eukprot:371332-Rhodomonas_salina.1